MIRIVTLLFVLVVFQACSGVDKFYRMDSDETVMYQFEENYKINAVLPSYNVRRISKCDFRKIDHTLDDGMNEPEVYHEHVPVGKCRPLYSKHGWTNDTAAPLLPVLLQSGTTIGSAAILGDNIKEGMKQQNVSDPDNISLNNSSRSSSRASSKAKAEANKNSVNQPVSINQQNTFAPTVPMPW